VTRRESPVVEKEKGRGKKAEEKEKEKKEKIENMVSICFALLRLL